MSTASKDSSLELRRLASRSATASTGTAAPVTPINRKPGEVWINGDVLACMCPQCHAPMSIRLWLMIGDCWQCGASVELSEEQERQALALLRKQKMPVTPKASPVPVAVRPAFKELPHRPKPEVVAAPAKPVEPPPVVRRAVATHAVPRKRPPLVKTDTPRHPISWKDVLGDMPAWFISALLHVIFMMLLGMWTIKNEKEDPTLVLALSFSPENRAGAPAQIITQPQVIEVADPGKEETLEPEQDDATLQAMRDAGELSVAPDAPAGNLPPLSAIVEAVSSPQTERMFQGRDPRIRAQVIEHEGGSIFTEQAVAQGLRWIAAHQNADGSWSLTDFSHVGECQGRCNGEGIADSDTGATALALLPMLGAGQTHQHGIYREQVGRGLRWLVEQQGSDGDLRGQGYGRMYAHGQAAIVLCEAYALTQEAWLREPAQKALDFIEHAQHPAGGWRYQPREQGDTSVVGWQLMALRSGKMAGLRVTDQVFTRAGKFLDGVAQGQHRGLYEYMAGHGVTETMTAEALLCRQYLGWSKNHLGLQEGVSALVSEKLPATSEPNIYYWYYATQVMHHIGGEPWRQWNLAMRDTLLALRNTVGHEAGSWDPVGGIHGGYDVSLGGRLYMTSLAVCTLQVYYRHLPLYRAVAVQVQQ